jgi:hypothetical protein
MKGSIIATTIIRQSNCIETKQINRRINTLLPKTNIATIMSIFAKRCSMVVTKELLLSPLLGRSIVSPGVMRSRSTNESILRRRFSSLLCCNSNLFLSGQLVQRLSCGVVSSMKSNDCSSVNSGNVIRLILSASSKRESIAPLFAQVSVLLMLLLFLPIAFICVMSANNIKLISHYS